MALQLIHFNTKHAKLKLIETHAMGNYHKAKSRKHITQLIKNLEHKTNNQDHHIPQFSLTLKSLKIIKTQMTT